MAFGLGAEMSRLLCIAAMCTALALGLFASLFASPGARRKRAKGEDNKKETPMVRGFAALVAGSIQGEGFWCWGYRAGVAEQRSQTKPLDQNAKSAHHTALLGLCFLEPHTGVGLFCRLRATREPHTGVGLFCRLRATREPSHCDCCVLF